MKENTSKRYRRQKRRLRSKSRKRIKRDKWYIVDLFRKNKYRTYTIIKKDFDTKEMAQRAIDKKYSHLSLYLDVVKGSKAIEYGFVVSKVNTLRIYVQKYEYPPEAETYQDMKSFRTKYRRWKRNYKKELKIQYAAQKEI